jgi:hypothetical protein
MTPAAGYSLSRALPSDVALGGESIAAFYQRYPIFSWPWAWRRFLLFLPFAIVPALIRGMSHGASVNDMADTLNITVRYVGANLVAIGLGPLAAAMVRHARLATRVERWLVITLVLLGVLAAMGVRSLANSYHAHRMIELGFDHGHFPARENIYATLQHGLDAGLEWFYLYIAGAGLALRAYLTESERWHEHRRQEQIQILRRQRDAADMQLSVLQAQGAGQIHARRHRERRSLHPHTTEGAGGCTGCRDVLADSSKLHRPGERDSRHRARWGRTAVAQLAWPGRQVAGEQRLPASLQGHVMQW